MWLSRAVALLTRTTWHTQLKDSRPCGSDLTLHANLFLGIGGAVVEQERSLVQSSTILWEAVIISSLTPLAMTFRQTFFIHTRVE
jgi:hypothetical protein